MTIDAMGTQTEIAEKIGWFIQKKEWRGLSSIGMEEKIIRKGKERISVLYKQYERK